MEKFCGAAQCFYDENPNSFYSPTIEHINEILMLNTIPMDFYEWKAIDQFMEEDMRRRSTVKA